MFTDFQEVFSVEHCCPMGLLLCIESKRGNGCCSKYLQLWERIYSLFFWRKLFTSTLKLPNNCTLKLPNNCTLPLPNNLRKKREHLYITLINWCKFISFYLKRLLTLCERRFLYSFRVWKSLGCTLYLQIMEHSNKSC